MSKFEGQLKEQMIKRMSIDNPWWIEGDILFVPSAIYAYWVSAYLFKNKRRGLLYSN